MIMISTSIASWQRLELYKKIIPVADLGEGPPRGPKFVFMQFSGKIGQIVGWGHCWRPPLDPLIHS